MTEVGDRVEVKPSREKWGVESLSGNAEETHPKIFNQIVENTAEIFLVNAE